mgnify:CR=1 FL=1
MRQAGQKQNFKKQKAQSIIELAVMGGLVLMILGLIIRYGFIFAHNQNAQYNALRTALKLSAETSTVSSAAHDWLPFASRSTASVLVINDKPTVQGGEKYASSMRSPFMAYGSGSFSSLMTYPLTYPETFGQGDWNSIPVFDMVINGQHFIFRTAGFRTYGAGPNITYALPGIGFEILPEAILNMNGIGYIGHGANSKGYAGPVAPGTMDPYTWKGWANDIPARNFSPSVPFLNYSLWMKFHDFQVEWYYDGTTQWIGDVTEWIPSGYQPFPNGEDELVFFKKIPKTDKKFCYGYWSPYDPVNFTRHCGGEADGFTQEELAMRWDLKRGWISDPVPPADRQNKQWQWLPVHASAFGVGMWTEGAASSLDVDFDGKEEFIIDVNLMGPHLGPVSGWKSLTTETEQDQTWHQAIKWKSSLATKIIGVRGVDYQAGDLDMTYDLSDEIAGKPKPGLVGTESTIRTVASGSLSIDQGPDGQGKTQYQSRQEGHSVDIIERKVQLSNNTGCFCGCVPPALNDCMRDALDDIGKPMGDWSRVPWSFPTYCENDNKGIVSCAGSGGELSCCEEEDNLTKTCFDYGEKMLYVRTILQDNKGVKFITKD